MKQKLFFTAAFLLLGKIILAQSFEGEIIYNNTYKSKAANFSSEQVKSMIGGQQEYYIRGGNYKATMNGSVVAAYYYHAKENKLYTEFQDGSRMYWNDAAVNNDSVLSFEVKKNAVRILGYNCDELILHTRKGTQIYDFAPQLAVDPSLFVNHKFGNWYDYLKIARAIPLRMIVEQDQVIITSEALAVKPAKLSDDYFVLPAVDEIVKSPY
ncbi:MAG TPA: hypothetical protein VE978_04500 [Chitinophagales bacterium]|nr:hypothetical protein [Chitinophagales bacterium]